MQNGSVFLQSHSFSLIFSPSMWCTPAVMCGNGSCAYTTVPPLLPNELLPFVSWASLSFDPNLERDSLTDSYFLCPVPKLNPENVTLVPGCSTRAAELWPASILLSLVSALKV